MAAHSLPSADVNTALLTRWGLVLGATIAAYHYSLLTLWRQLTVDTPLAYLGLVPFIALGLACLRARSAPHEPAIHDRQLDFILGLPLVVSAILILTVLPERMSTLFWVYRIDLLSMPLFVAGMVTLVFGSRALWRVRLPVAFLFFAWPLPWTVALTRWLDTATSATLSALIFLTKHFPVAKHLPDGDGSLFAIDHHGTQTTVSIASSCAGVNSVTGFLLVGGAVVLAAKGRTYAKLIWLVLGATLIWGLNVLRIMAVLYAGKEWGSEVAIQGLHPVIGLILFAIGVAIMTLLAPLFGLRMRSVPRTIGRSVHLPRLGTSALIIVVCTAVGLYANDGMRRYRLVAGDLGAARLTAFATSPATVAGYSPGTLASYDWVQRFFGSDSTWIRYAYSASGSAAPIGLGGSIVTDVITTSHLSKFEDYGLEACYEFHGYNVRAKQKLTLGGGVTGETLTYVSNKQTWTSLSWIWPVALNGKTKYERVVLIVPSKAGQNTATPQTRTNDLVQGLGVNAGGGGKLTPVELSTRAALIEFAKKMVNGRGAVTV